MRWVYRVLPTTSALVVAAASFALSYVAIRDVAAEIGAVPNHLAWLVPVVIDGGIICASVVIWANAQLGHRREVFPFVIVTALVAVSVVVNTAHAAPNTLAKVIAALPPLVLLATLELVAASYRSVQRSLDETDTPTAAATPAPAAVPAPAVVPAANTEAAPAPTTSADADTADGGADAEVPAPAPKKAPAKKAPAKRAPAAKKAPAKKAPAKRAPAAKKAPAKPTATTPEPAAPTADTAGDQDTITVEAPRTPQVDRTLVGVGAPTNGNGNGNGSSNGNGSAGAVRRPLRVESMPPEVN